jgi:hypothetical protein
MGQREGHLVKQPGAAGWRHRAVARRLKSALPLLLVVLVGAAPPPIILIEIVPTSVVVHHDPTVRTETSFELEARLWTETLAARRSIIESDGYTLTWSTTQPWLIKTGQQGFRAVFKIAQSIQGTATVKVVANGNASDPVNVTVVNGPTAGEDFLTATYKPGQVPDVALVSGIRNTPGGPCGFTFTAFVAGVGLGNVVDPCTGDGGAWEAAVLSVGHKSVVATGQWSGQQNTVNAGALQGSPRVIPVALRVMLGDDELSEQELKALRDATMLLAVAEVEAANGVLASTRTGVELAKPDTLTIEDLDPAEVDAYGEVAVADCRDGDDRTLSRDVPGKLNVYYVNRLYNLRGRACPPHRWRKYPVIYVERDIKLQTTLVHEVGHALGLTVPKDGHTNVVGGLDLSNVMTKGYTDWDPGGRRRLTVGQVFRMNADSASWLSWATVANGALVRESAAPRLACQCGGGDPSGSCPRVADDIAPPSAATDASTDRDCWDKLFLRNAPANERPVAIIAGRRWRAPPEECSSFLRGWDASLPQEVWVGLQNVTRHGDCSSRAVLFYRRYGVQFVNLSEPAFGLTQTSDETMVLGSPSKPLPVRVRLYITLAMISSEIVAQEIEIARTVFGDLNRSGIALVFEFNTTGCPLVGPGPGEIEVCYAPLMQEEGRLAAPRRIRLGHWTPTTLAHFIGRALGLARLDLPSNIMRPTPALRGKRLTIGQVFRINAAVGVLSSCDDAECPLQALDMGP